MAMAAIRGPGRRGKSRSHATTAVLIGATAVLAVLVGVGVVAFLHSRSTNAAQRGKLPLPDKITSEQPVGLANPGRGSQAGSSGSSATLLDAGAGGLVFSPSSGGENVQSSQQWQADQLSSGGLVLLSPGERCLTAVGGGADASVQLQGCDTGLDQRWYHPFEGTDSQGRDYWELRSASDGRCLGLSSAASGGSVVADLQKCSAAKPWAQLIMFWSAY